MNANGVLIHKAALSKTDVQSQFLKEGSSVSVKVIKNINNNTYQCSLAGVRINIQSERTLQAGFTFLAKISLKDGLILLKPQIPSISIDKSFKLNQLIEKNNNNPFDQVSNNYIRSILENFSLPNNNLSYHIFLQFKQLGLKFDSALMKKIYLLSKKFSGKEKAAAEIISNLILKGIEVKEEDIISMLDFDIEDNQNKNKLYDTFFSYEKIDFRKQLENYLSLVFNCKLDNKFGLLTLSNQIYSSKTNGGNWIKLPFEITKDEDCCGSGFINLFFLNKNNLQKVKLYCYHNQIEYIFLMELQNKKISSIKFYKSNLDEEEINNEINKLKERFSNNVEISWSHKSYLKGNACESEEIYIMDGEI